MLPDIDTSTFYGTRPQLQPVRTFQPRKEPRVLLIEDDPVMVKLLSFALEKRGFEVKIATDGKKALDYLTSTEEPNLVLLDLMLPFINGYEILSEIRKNNLWKSIPVIVMTAEARRQCINEAFDAGANDYLVKPVQFDDLLVRVKSFTEFN